MKIIYWILIGAVLAAMVAAAAIIISARRSAGPLSPEQAEALIREKLQKAVDRGAPAVLSAVDAPALGLELRLAAGAAAPGSRFHSASVGKMHTAAVIMVLAEQGRLSLDDRLGGLIDTAPWKGLLVLDGRDALPDLTVGQLLTHTSGLADFFEDRTRDGSPNLYQSIIDEPERVWTIESRLAYARDHYDTAGVPGVYHYSDTNYDLLGLVIEAVTGMTFEEARRDLVLNQSGMSESGAWPPVGWDGGTLPGPEAGGLVPVVVEGTDLSRAPSLSIDGPGGGLAVTLDDMVQSMRSVTAGSAMPPLGDFDVSRGEWGRFNRGIDYGRGMMVIRPGRLTPFMKGYPDLFGHSGLTGSYLYYVPEYDAVITGSFNSVDWGRSRHVIYILEVLNILSRVERARPETF